MKLWKGMATPPDEAIPTVADSEMVPNMNDFSSSGTCLKVKGLTYCM